MNARQESIINLALLWLVRLLIALAAWYSAQAVWAIAGLFQSVQLPPAVEQPAVSTAVQAPQYDLQALIDRPLFGRVQRTETAVEAPQEVVQRSRLNVKLLGVIAADGDGGVAILFHDNKTWTYSAGEKLETGGDITLDQVAVDHVIVSRNGSREKIFLEDSSLKDAEGLVRVGAQQRPSATTVSQRSSRNAAPAVNGNRINLRSAAVRRELGDVRSTLRTQPLKLAKYLRIAPKRERGQIVGYSVQSGPSKELFQQLGLREGEVATTINGQPLGSLDHTTLYGMLNASRQFQVELKSADGSSRMITVAL